MVAGSYLATSQASLVDVHLWLYGKSGSPILHVFLVFLCSQVVFYSPRPNKSSNIEDATIFFCLVSHMKCFPWLN